MTSKPSNNQPTAFLVPYIEEERKHQRKHQNGAYPKSRDIDSNLVTEKHSVLSERHNGCYPNNTPFADSDSRCTQSEGQTSLHAEVNGTKSREGIVEWPGPSHAPNEKSSPVRNQTREGNGFYFSNRVSIHGPKMGNGAYPTSSNGLSPANTDAKSILQGTCMATHAANNVRSMTHKQWLRHSAGQKCFSEKKSLEERAVVNTLDSIDRVAMNASPLSASPAAQATDLSQQSGVLHREESSKVYPHLIMPPYSLEQRGRHEQLAKSRESFHDDEKKLSLSTFKHSVWGGFPNPAIFSEAQQQGAPHQQPPYDSGFYTDVNSSGIPHHQARHYDVNPILLKDSSMIPMVKEEGHHGNVAWEKPPFDRMLGGYKPVRNPCYLKPPPVDLDDVSV